MNTRYWSMSTRWCRTRVASAAIAAASVLRGRSGRCATELCSRRSDGHVLGAPGLAGGKPGATARLTRNAGTAHEEALSSKTASIVLAAGETVRIETGGGGGFGDPAERDPTALARDLRAGKLSRNPGLPDTKA